MTTTNDPRDEDLIPSRPIHELADREILILMCERQSVANRRLNDLHGRIVSLETWRTFLAGSWAAVTVIGGIAGKWAWNQLNRNP